MLDLGAVADNEVRHDVRLPRWRARPRVDLDEGDLGALADAYDVAQEDRLAAVLAALGTRVEQEKGLGGRGAGRDVEHDAVGEEGGVQGEHRIVGEIRALDFLLHPRRRVLDHAREKRLASLRAAHEPGMGEARTVGNHRPISFEFRAGKRRRDSRLGGGAIGAQRLAGRDRKGVLERPAQVRVLPRLEAPMGEAQRRERADRLAPHLLQPRPAGQAALVRRKLLGERGLGLRSQHLHGHRSSCVLFLRRPPVAHRQAALSWYSA